MKKRYSIFVGIVCWPLLTWSQEVYDGYDAYYIKRHGLFTTTTMFQFSGPHNSVVLWKGKQVDLTRAIPFPGEFTVNDDLGSHINGYENFPFACIEGQSSSASGTAVRHMSVYLIKATRDRTFISYKLPSLFASCLGVRLDSFNRILFDKDDYIYTAGNDMPAGVRLNEFFIDKKTFKPTGHFVELEFTESENVWKFRVKDSK